MPERQHLGGKRFGKWTVLEYVDKQKYLCRCDCGTERVIYSPNLTTGKTRSCGCANRLEYVGKKFDRLTVLRKLPMTKSYVEYECQCDCGKIITRSQSYFKTASQFCCPDCKRPNIKDLTGQRFGRLVAVRYAGVSKGNQTLWECKCDCGNTVLVHAQNLKSGHTSSCGCYNYECISARNRTHGETKTRIYRIWHDMNYRCSSPKHRSYPLYGGKGVKVCDAWKDYETFRDWALQSGYKDGLSIDRIDSEKDYCPENCRWATDTEQANNTNRNRCYTIDGVTDTLANWCRKYNMPYVTASSRVLRGWNIMDALTLPPGQPRGTGQRMKEKRETGK